jgi:hypothetical protein
MLSSLDLDQHYSKPMFAPKVRERWMAGTSQDVLFNLDQTWQCPT